MGFDSGAASFRLYFLQNALPEDAIDRFAQHAAPPISTLGEGESRGWVTGRHLLDRNINVETACRGSYYFMALQQAERKVPPSLLKAECAMEELAHMAAEEKAFVSRQEKAAIKRSVTERLLPTMPPQIKGTYFVHAIGSPFLFADALPTKQSDLFSSMFQQTQGFTPILFTPEVAALERTNCDVNQWNRVCFSPDVPVDLMDLTPGRDFLTWLWFHSESRGGLFSLESGEQAAAMIEGPLLFAHEGEGAYETVLRKGEPVNSAEAKVCLMSGKKLKSAKVTLAMGDEIWMFGLDADEFLFKNVKIPRIEELLDGVSHFEERMRRLQRFCDIFMQVYDVYTAERSDSEIWANTKTEMHQWVKNRTGRI